MMMTETRRIVERGPVGGEGAQAGGNGLLPAIEPAIASSGVRKRKRPISMTKPPVALYKLVLVVRPAKAEPLLAF